MNYYELLNVSESATFKEIKVAYRKKAIEFHPDINKSENAPSMFLLIQTAYETLSNSEKRRCYDIKLNSIRNQKVSHTNNQTQTTKPNYNPPHTAAKKNYSVLFCFIVIFFFAALFFIIGQLRSPNKRVLQPHNYQESNYSDFSDKKQDIKSMKDEILKEDISQYYSSDVVENKIKTGDSPYNSYFGMGVYSKYSLSEITVDNISSQDVIIILKNKSSNIIVRNVYIKSGCFYVVDQIPDGIYDMKCYYGNSWDSKIDMGKNLPKGGFTKNISYSASISSVNIMREKTSDGYDYPTYSVKLQNIIKTNMGIKAISEHDFFDKE